MQPTFLVTVLLLATIGVPAQTHSSRLTFDVAAIHPTQPGSDRGIIKPLPGGNGYMVENMTVKMMMSTVYRVPMRQITGGPDWFSTATFSVEAKSEGTFDLEQLHTMFQNLLADRFGLRFHIKTKEGEIYALVLDKSGPKMKPDGNVSDLNIPIVRQTPSKWVGTKVSMQYLCLFITQQLRYDPRPIVDKTGLNQVYDFTLEFAPELPPGLTKEDLLPELQNMPTITEAVRQLGLRLEPQKGPMAEYVIDQVQKPSEN